MSDRNTKTTKNIEELFLALDCYEFKFVPQIDLWIFSKNFQETN